MESPTPVSRYVPSKKRVFLSGSSSSSSGCKDVEVLEISPPVNQTPKPKLSKQKEVIYPEVIDVDMEDDSDDVMLTDGEVESSAKGKEPLSKLGLSNNESGSDILVSNNGASGLHDSVNPDDFGSSLFFGEDEWIDTYYEDILFDDYAMLESHFDHMDMPSGIEAPFPWLPISSQNNSNMPTATTSTNPSSQPQSDGVNLPPGLNSSHSLWPSKQIQVGDLSTSSSSSMTGTHMNASNKHIKAKFNPKWESSLGQKKPATSTSTANMSSQSYKGSFTRKFDKEPLHAFVKTKRKPRAVSSMYHNQFAGAPSYPTPLNSGGSHPTLTPPPSASSVGPFVPPLWTGLSMSMFEPFLGPPPSGLMHESPSVSWAQKPANSQNGVSSTGTSPPTKIEQRIMDVVLLNFNNFKKFDTVEDYSDHHYAKNGYCAKQVQPPKNWAKRIQEEWKILERDLPDKIFVRVYESRMDLLRAVIVGAEGTPYHDGLFFFDVFFPGSYPNVPPHVHYHSGGLRINPNLYNCGKVCLSLLNTWSGSQKEKWIPGVSTMLQVLVSIQGLILNAKPYFNEPGYANLSGSINGEQRSLEYNERTFMYSLQTMMYNMRRPPKYFEDFVVGHFCEHARDILVSCKAYLEGAQVGCLVKGGVQDVDEGDKSCSQHFKNNLAGFITVLVNTFTEIGAKDCQEFLSLAPKENAKPSGPPSGLTFFN